MPSGLIDLISSQAAEPERRIRFQWPGRTLSARQLIALAVAEQCRGVDVRAAPSDAPAGPRTADVDRETAAALEAFERRRILLLVGGRHVRSLDETLVLDLEQPIRFIRLLPLAGG